MKKLFLVIFALIVPLTLFAAPTSRLERTLIPELDSRYYLGTSTPSVKAWLAGFFDELCLTADSCITSWPSGSGGGVGTTTPWTAGELAQVVDNGTVTSIATSSLGLPTFTDLLSYLTLSAWYATTTDGLDEGSINLYNQTHTGEVTGATALTVANNVIDEANLLITGSPTDNYLLQASSTSAGGFVWVSTTTLGLGGSITVPLPIAEGGTNATSFTTTNGLVYFDGTSLVNADLTWSPAGDTLDSGAGQALDILGQDGLFLDGQGASGLVLRSDGLIRFSSNNGSGGYLSFDTDALTVDRAIAVPDEDGTFALVTAGNPGDCVEFSTAFTITTSGAPCGGGSSNWDASVANLLYPLVPTDRVTIGSSTVNLLDTMLTVVATSSTETALLISAMGSTGLTGMNLSPDGDIDLFGVEPSFDLYNLSDSANIGLRVDGNASASFTSPDGTAFATLYAEDPSGGVGPTLVLENATGTVLTLSSDTDSYINTGHNFGVGNGAPSDVLHVTGTTRLEGALKDSTNSPGTSGQILSSTVTGTDWIDAGAGSSNWTVSGAEIFPNSARSIEVPFFQATSTTDSYTVGNLGVGSTTPWARLSVSNDSISDYTEPIFSVATSSAVNGQLFNVFATTTPNNVSGGITQALNTLRSGARVVIGSVVNSVQNLFVNGSISSSWTNSFCDGFTLGSFTVSADTANVCGSISFDESSAATLAGTFNTNFDLGGALMTVTSGAGADGATLAAPGFSLSNIGTSTPSLEVLIGTLGGMSSTTQAYVGFADLLATNPSTAPTQGCYIAATSTDNWQAVADPNGGTILSTNTSVATSTPNQRWRITMTDTTCDFWYSTSQNTALTKIVSYSSSIPSGVVNARAGIHLRRATGGAAAAPLINVYMMRYWRALQWQRLQF